MIKKIIYSLVLLLTVLLVLQSAEVVVWAQDSQDDEADKKAERIREEVESIIAEADNLSPVQLQEKKAFCGNLISHDKDGKILTIEVQEKDKEAIYTDDTVFIDITRQKIEPRQLEIGSYVIAMGYIDRLGKGKLNVKRVVVQETPQEIKRHSFFGQVSDISQEEEVFSLSIKEKDLVLEILADKAEILSGAAAKEMIDFDELAEDQKIVLVGTEEESHQIRAAKIYIISSLEATPSP